MIIPLREFLDAIAQSGLVSASDLARVRKNLELTAGAEGSIRLARRLVREGTLTDYQARKLLAGATRGFFLGGYRILRPLGEGGMGKVFLAVCEESRRKVAIKVLPPRRIQEEAGSLARFRREMELSRRFQHPNVARTLDVGSDGDIHFMVLEYIPGLSLYDLVRNPKYGPLRVPDAARLFLKVVDGLEAAHHAGLVHRDVKPSNIMITPEGDAKLLDLGLARALGEDGGLTRANTVLGTLDYASPEQLRDAAQADPRSDLYSLGCTIYFALAGRPPFEGGDIINKIFKQRMDDPEPLERVSRGVPAAFAAIVRKLMAKEPSERHQTAAEVRIDLARWTDPQVVRTLLGAEAEAARSFRPPPPSLSDEELRLLAAADDSGAAVSLRELGAAEPSAAPRRRRPPLPLPARIRRLPTTSPPPVGEPNWLLPFSLLVLGMGLLAILAIALWSRP